MGKKLWTLLLCLGALLGLGGSVSAADFTGWVPVDSTTTQWEDGKKYYLTGDVTVSETITVSGTVTFDLNGYMLQKTGNGRVLEVDGANLTILDTAEEIRSHSFAVDGSNGLWTLDESGSETVQGGIITGGKEDSENGGGIEVKNKGTLTMTGGSIVGCRARGAGGGVWVIDSTFIMSGGSIVGCVGLSGGGVCIWNSTLTMSGEARITDCVAERHGYAGDEGGGVYVAGSASLILNDEAMITRCKAVSGSGVYVYSGSFTMNDQAAVTNCTGSDYGVEVWYNSFTMNGGTISGCTDENGEEAGLRFGREGSESTFWANGGQISGKCFFAAHGIYDTKIKTAEGKPGTTFTGEVLNVGLIQGGIYKGPVWNGKQTSTLGYTGGIQGGTFYGKVENQEYSWIHGGIFYGEVNNESGSDDITGGEFLGGLTGNLPQDFESKWCQVVFEMNGGTPQLATGYVTKNNPLPKPEDPTREGYGFTNWFVDAELTTPYDFTAAVTGPLTLWAGWGADAYAIVYHLNGGQNHVANPASYVYGQGVPQLEAPTRPGYAFGGWFANASLTGAAITAIGPDQKGTVELYARWRDTSAGSDEPVRTSGKAYADEAGTVALDKADVARVAELFVKKCSLDTLDCKGLSLRLETERTQISLSAKALGQILDANADSLILKMGQTTLTLRRETLQMLNRQMDGKDLVITLTSGAAALAGLPEKQRTDVEEALKQDGLSMLGAVTGRFTIGGREVDWSKNPAEMIVELQDTQREPEQKLGEPKVVALLADGEKPWQEMGGEDEPLLAFRTDNGLGLWQVKLQHFSTYLVVARLQPTFTDVSAEAYYYEAVQWAAENGIAGGVSETLFGPNEPCTRAQMVAFLWRAAGSPEPTGESRFADVPPASYYAKALAWALEQKIAFGMTEETFAPDEPCTRAQSISFLYRALGQKMEKTVMFADVPAASYYAEAVDWAAATGVTSGVTAEQFAPDALCTRGQIVSFLYRAQAEKG